MLGDPAPVVLAAPFAVFGALALLHRPREAPAVVGDRDHQQLHEGQGTISRLLTRGTDGVEQVTRVVARAPYTTVSPRASSVLVERDGPWPEVRSASTGGAVGAWARSGWPCSARGVGTAGGRTR